jgi:cupin 2 domain-containing protein
LIDMSEITAGRLLEPSDAPHNGERVEEIAHIRNLVIEQILSGQVEPADYLQTHDEWVLVLSGGAALDVDGNIRELHTHDRVLLRAGTPHRLLTANPAPPGWPCTYTPGRRPDNAGGVRLLSRVRYGPNSGGQRHLIIVRTRERYRAPRFIRGCGRNSARASPGRPNRPSTCASLTRGWASMPGLARLSEHRPTMVLGVGIGATSAS